ncbi:MAG: M18 family aminopeptidase, partial [Lachnospiraceae bacterium]|nr:M18 family aminopeptidase [Candidatus Equihabitans merdae]
GKYLQLNTEGYGGMLCAPWLDRPLSVAGRVVVGTENGLETKLIALDRALLMIPSVAIHMNREANDGMKYNKQVDMLPLFGGQESKAGDFKKMIAAGVGTTPDNIYGSDLFLYNRQTPSVWGANEEFYSAPRLDDLACAFTTLIGFLQGKQDKNINVFACFDNEEVGSLTKQGADSTFLRDTLQRANEALGKTPSDFMRAQAGSFMLSCDNAHAVHPNHPEKSDAGNGVYMNEGIVIKSHAGQKYTSDGVSMAMFKRICDKVHVPVQYFANRSDMAGGSTLGNIAMAQMSMNTVDIGLPQLAMHSPYETAGVKDVAYMIDAVKAFYDTHVKVSGQEIKFE